MNPPDRSFWLMLDDIAVLRTAYLRLLLWSNHRLIRARCTVYSPCQEIPRVPFEPFGQCKQQIGPQI